jgi:5-methylthioadenosine/S-adenosylhomocysteine deaminase
MEKEADILLTNAFVLTMDEDYTQYEPGAVAITGEDIVAVGHQTEIEATYRSQQTIDCGGKVLMPGLINAHTHIPMTLLRGLADDLRLDVWLMGYIMPVEREFVSPEFVKLGAQLACAEFIRTGVTCFADMYYFEEDVAEAVAEAGLRAVCSQTVLKFSAPDAEAYEESLAAAHIFIQEWKDHPLIVPSIGPHAPYTSTEEILRSCIALAVEYDVPLNIHIAETEIEVENMRNEHDMPVIPYVKKQNLFDAKVIAAHCVHIDRGEMHTLKHHGAGVATNPSSNFKLSSGIASVNEMLEIGLNVGIGTDGPASNNNLDMFEEIRLASFASKHITKDPTSLPARTAIEMATRMGANAIHMGHITGSLEPGKRADLILVDINTTHNNPRFRRDPNGIYAQLVYAAKSSDVTDVLVNGRWLMRDRELKTLHEEELIQRSNEFATQIDSFLTGREESVLSKLITIGGATEVESFEIQVKVRIDNPEPILEAMEKPEIEIIYSRHYQEYDSYFLFDDPSHGQIRYREDEFIDESGEIDHVRYRLTLVGASREREFPSDVMLSRSRYLAPATHSLRFYQEYFQPSSVTFIQKNRLRWLVRYKATEFYVNIDKLNQPDLGYFLEVKSRTWSRRDADRKSGLITELVSFLGASPEETIPFDYTTIVNDS